MLQRSLFVVGLLAATLSGVPASGEEARPSTSLLKLDASSDTPRSAGTADPDDVARLARFFSEGQNAEDDLRLLVDYHPTLDRWTERNNRIRITPYLGVWFFSGELDIEANEMFGARVSWEVPGFIAIHFDLSYAPFARLNVKPGGSPRNSERHASGDVTSFYVSVAIFNPELSNENLAWWAGAGLGFFYMNFSEGSVQNTIVPTRVEFQQIVPSVKLFVELDYKINENFHVGAGIAGHFLYATYTDDGRYYDVNGVEGGVATGGALKQRGRNEGIVGHLAFVTELTLNVSIVF